MEGVMPERIVVELANGRKLLFGGGGSPTGLGEVGLGEAVAKAAGERFQAGLATLGDLVGMLENAVGRLANRPDKIEMEFRASLTGECDLWVVSGEGEAEFKVTLAWEK
jgi:hypothetical protein